MVNNSGSNSNQVDILINSLLENIPEDYEYGLFYNNEWEYILNDLRCEKRALNKKLKSKDSRYTDFFLESNIDIVDKAIKKVQDIIKKKENFKMNIQEATILALTGKLNEEQSILSKVRKRFEDLSYTTGREHKLDNPSEYPLDKWTIKDFVAEADYEMDMRSSELYDSDMKAEYNKYKRFVDTYSKYITDDMKCYEKHSSKRFDN